MDIDNGIQKSSSSSSMELKSPYYSKKHGISKKPSAFVFALARRSRSLTFNKEHCDTRKHKLHLARHVTFRHYTYDVSSAS